ncbi:MAG: aldo/keto reductase [Oscillospiraceae bacterium]|nr:aldo/keto reductase [Oscillospiraceae bacterium]
MKKLGFGCMRLPLLSNDDPSSIDHEQLCKMVDTFLERGFTYFDTAYMYHDFKSEIAIREALVKRHPRESFLLADKLPLRYTFEEGDTERIFEEQLEKCGVDYFDYYLVHNVNSSYMERAEKFKCFDFVKQKKAEGKAKHIGFSFHDTPELLDRLLTEHPEFEFVQIQLNYLDWDSPSIQSRKNYEVIKKHGKKVWVMEPVKGGMLAKVPEEAEKAFKAAAPEASVPSWAVRFAASCPEVNMVLSGMSSIEQLMDNTSYMADFKPLTEVEREVIAKAVSIINSGIEIPCTNCRYCVDGCPKNIAIPAYFALFNSLKASGNVRMMAPFLYYRNIAANAGKASDCIGCRHCESGCPQHLEITKFLKKVAETFEQDMGE